MRFLSLVKVATAGIPEGGPSQELMTEMGKLITEMTKAGVLLDTAGLAPVDEGVRVQIADGKMTVLDGPFAEAKEFIGGYALMQAKDLDEAVEWTKRFVAIHGGDWTVECEVRRVEEAG